MESPQKKFKIVFDEEDHLIRDFESMCRQDKAPPLKKSEADHLAAEQDDDQKLIDMFMQDDDFGADDHLQNGEKKDSSDDQDLLDGIDLDDLEGLNDDDMGQDKLKFNQCMGDDTYDF